jgi:enoyl-CoA hydratase/carnithine racemase
MPHPNVLADRSSAGYLRLLLSRPDQRNALVPGMVVALTEAMQADGDAVVLLGSTDPTVFCAGAALEICMTGRWVDAAEALKLGLVHRVDDDPDRTAAGLAETLVAGGPLGPGRIKTVASAGGLLDRLRTERQVNRAAFAQALDGEAW